jgi:hypothetical protein
MVEPDNLVLVYLRRLDEKFDRMAGDVADIKIPLTNIEERMGQADLRQAQTDIAIAGINRRLDRVDARLDRIERRLDLVELPH